MNFGLEGELRTRNFELETYYATSCTKSANRSPIMIAVKLVLARVTTGMIDASPTQRFRRPWTRNR